MKHINSVFFCFLLVVAFITWSSFRKSDQLQNKVSSVKIGKQVWMANNLDVSKFRNGDLIPQAKTNAAWKKARLEKQPAWCYYENKTENGVRYGKLYNWYAVNDARGLAPKGWRIPTDDDWEQLTKHLGGKKEAGKKLKSATDWRIPKRNAGHVGFNALPAGFRYTSGAFNHIGSQAYWWSSTQTTPDYAWNRNINLATNGITRYNYGTGIGLSVRCIKY